MRLNHVIAMHERFTIHMVVGMSLWFGWLWVAGWPGTSQSVDICESLEDWTTDISNISDSDEEDDVLLVSFDLKISLRFTVIWGDLLIV